MEDWQYGSDPQVKGKSPIQAFLQRKRKSEVFEKFFSPLLLVIGLSPSPALFQLEILSHSPLSRIYAFLFFWARLWCSLAITSTR